MTAIQLELAFEQNEDDLRIVSMQHQIDALHESMGKVRRKLFSQMGEMQKAWVNLQQENLELRRLLMEVRDEKEKWVYTQGDNLFDVQIHKGTRY